MPAAPRYRFHMRALRGSLKLVDDRRTDATRGAENERIVPVGQRFQESLRRRQQVTELSKDAAGSLLFVERADKLKAFGGQSAMLIKPIPLAGGLNGRVAGGVRRQVRRKTQKPVQ